MGQLLLDADLGAAADEMDLNLRTKAPTLKKWPSDGGWNWSHYGRRVESSLCCHDPCKGSAGHDRNRPFPGK